MFGMKKVEPEISRSDKILHEISALLFPKFEVREVEGEKYSIDSSVDSNIEAVIADIQEGYVDEICVTTLKACFEKIYKVRELLRAFHEMDPDVKKYVIAMGEITSPADQIEAAEDDSL
jgi:hypothetical protein